jgi:hypothetical protein
LRLREVPVGECFEACDLEGEVGDGVLAQRSRDARDVRVGSRLASFRAQVDHAIREHARCLHRAACGPQLLLDDRVGEQPALACGLGEGVEGERCARITHRAHALERQGIGHHVPALAFGPEPATHRNASVIEEELVEVALADHGRHLPHLDAR